MAMRKIIQVSTTCQAPSQTRDEVREVADELRVVALCDDGSVWTIRPDTYEPQWEPLSAIPQGQ